MANTKVTHLKKYIRASQSIVLEHHSAGTVFPISSDAVGSGELLVTIIVLEPCDEDGNVHPEKKKSG